MTTNSALEEISNLHARIESLKQQAVSEIAAKIAQKKSELRALETDYEQLTGKTLRSEQSTEKSGKRTRLTNEEKKALPGRILEILGNGEMPLGLIVGALGGGIPKSAVKRALSNGKLFKMTGERSNAQYTVK